MKIVLIARSLSVSVAHAQTALAIPEQQVAQANELPAHKDPAQKRVAAPKAKAQERVGPMSFCNIYFGS